jgi:predicted permease
VEAASVVSQLPLSGRKYSGGFSVEGVGEEDLEALRCAVGPSYFQVMGIPLLQGRAFSARDRAASPGVVIIDETLARRFWPRGDAVGKRLKRGRMDSDRPWLTVVGVVANVKSEALDADALPQMYFPYTQLTLPQMFVVLQSPQGDPVQLADAVRSTVLRLDGEQPVAMIQSMDEYLSSSLRRQRFLTLLLTTFALLGLTLAVLGIYAVMSSFVTERTYEVAIRMALGAQPREVLRMLFRQSMLLGVAGITAGLAGTLLLAPALASQLYHLSPLDPLVYLLASALLLSAVFFAAYVPARKAVRVDPVISLRHS